MRWLFSIAIFTSATLLFLVQPMVGKMLLPKLGGTPAVWITCMVFFQAVLLAGYTYTHLLTNHVKPRPQVLVHTCVLCLPLVVLPIGVGAHSIPPSEENPIPWLFTALLSSVGFPFFVLATSAPLLQRWFAETGGSAGRDPYFLYAASNLGSMLALLGYPTLVEPFLSLNATRWLSQSWLWSAGYACLIGLFMGCGASVWRLPRRPGARPDDVIGEAPEDHATPSTALRLRWVALAFAPSSLMLGVTTHITMDIAAVPLLWVLPLALYLLSFILVFARWPASFHIFAVRALPLAVLALVAAKVGGVMPHVGGIIILHLLALFLAALVCHGELARSRPSPRYLTQFYLLMSLGGVLGGIFNALVAPLVFTTVAEYPIALGVVCLLLPPLKSDANSVAGRLDRRQWSVPMKVVLDGVLAAALGLAVYGLSALFWWPASEGSWLSQSRRLADQALGGLSSSPQALDRLRSVIVYAIPAALCYLFVARPIRFGLAVVAVLFAGAAADRFHPARVLHQERSFFGTLRVNVAGPTYSLIHGTTLHGVQVRTPEHVHEPQTYFSPSGPAGQIFAAYQDTRPERAVGVIGLGAGSLACYGRAGQPFTYYEIDPAVARVARNTDYFTFLGDCAADLNIVLGDARLRLVEAPDQCYGLLVLDAFSSDAIPIHLITREAVELYLDKLAPDGILAAHISNRHLNLEPVLANIGKELGLVVLIERDQEIDTQKYPNKLGSVWVVIARHKDHLGALSKDSRWQPAHPDPAIGVWTDDYSNIWSVFTN